MKSSRELIGRTPSHPINESSWRSSLNCRRNCNFFLTKRLFRYSPLFHRARPREIPLGTIMVAKTLLRQVSLVTFLNPTYQSGLIQ